MLGFMRARNESTSASVSERFISAAMGLSCCGVGSETGMASSFARARRVRLHELAGWLRRARPAGGGSRVGVQVAGREMAGPHLAQGRLDVAADVADVRLAARVEAASGRRG